MLACITVEGIRNCKQELAMCRRNENNLDNAIKALGARFSSRPSHVTLSYWVVAVEFEN